MTWLPTLQHWRGKMTAGFQKSSSELNLFQASCSIIKTVISVKSYPSEKNSSFELWLTPPPFDKLLHSGTKTTHIYKYVMKVHSSNMHRTNRKMNNSKSLIYPKYLKEVEHFFSNVFLLKISTLLLHFIRMNAQGCFPVYLLYCCTSYQICQRHRLPTTFRPEYLPQIRKRKISHCNIQINNIRYQKQRISVNRLIKFQTKVFHSVHCITIIS